MKKIKYLLLAALMTISVGTQAQNIFPATITALSEFNDSMIVRIAEIEVYPQYLAEYLAYANEVDRLSVERALGVRLVVVNNDGAQLLEAIIAGQ